MYLVLKTEDAGATWAAASEHTQLIDAQWQMANFIANGVDAEALKIGIRDAEGTITDYTP